MQKKLAKHGNSLALVIDKPVAEVLGLTEKSVVRVISDGRRLVVTPVENPELERKLDALLQDEAALDRLLTELQG